MGNLSTPLGTDQYSRYMATLFDDTEIIGVPTAGQSFFGNTANMGLTLFSPNAAIVEIDILRGNEKLAAMIQRGTNSRPIAGQKNTSEQKYTTVGRKYPLIEEEGDINADQLNQRMAGENPYEMMSKMDRQRQLGMRHHMEHIRRCARTFEYLSWQSLLTGTMPSLLGTTETDLIYDFYRRSTHIFDVAVAWDAVGADIMGDTDTACELVRQDGHVEPDMYILGGEAMDAFIKDTTVAALADNRRFELIEVSTNNPVPAKYMRYVNSGLTPRGRLRTPKGYTLWMFTYVDTYDNASGTAVKYMPEDSAFVASSQARCDRYFGPSEVLPMVNQRAMWYQEMFGFNPLAAPMPMNVKNMGAILNMGMFYFDAYPSANQKSVTIRTQAAPIFATTMTDGFVTMNNLIT